MRIQVAVPEAFASPPVIDAVLEAVTRLDESMIREGKSPTSRELVKQGAIWRPENMGDEHFDHGATIAKRGWGDCDDWAPLHAATLRASGEDPGAVARVVQSGPSTYHAIVQRSDGQIDDPSIAAGMKPARVVGGDEAIEVWACDPHDGRIYQGSLLPTVAPLSIHCGPALAIRGAHVVGGPSFYEARVDVPLNGSPLLHVRSYWRHKARRRVHGIQGGLPYAISCSSIGCTPFDAINEALCGAIRIGDASELNTSLDRYKLLAVQASLTGATPGQVREALVRQMTDDLQRHAQATGTHPEQHSQALLAELAQQGHATPGIVGGFFDDISKAAGGIVSAVSNVANTVAHAASSPIVQTALNPLAWAGNVAPWGDIIHGVQAAVSVVPGIGTAVSDVLATAETAYNTAAAVLGGHPPLLAAIDAAYNYALASIPGAASIRFILDPVKDTLENLVIKKEPVSSSILNAILNKVPDQPKFGPISPRSLAGTLAHLIVDHLGVKNDGPGPSPPGPVLARPPQSSHPATAVFHAPPAIKLPTLAFRMPPPRPPPPKRPPVVMHVPAAPPAAKPLGVPHAALHVTQAPARAAAPRRPPPGSPGAPPGATHWTCAPLPGGQWQCRWI